MNRLEANKLLDKAREGHKYTFEQISAALYASGDLHDPMRSARMETAPHSEGAGTWQGESTKLVASGESRHCADSWAGYSRYLDKRNEQAAA
jgi:hypothetical protein